MRPHSLTLTLTTFAAAAVLAACGKAPEAPAPAAAPAPVEAPAPAPAPMAAPASVDESPADHTEPPVSRFKANGYSPAWQAELSGDKLSFEVPDFAGPDTQLRTITVTTSTYATGVNYSGMDGKVPVHLDLNGTSCDKTGDAREFTVTLKYGKSTYQGCADGLR